MGSYRKKEKNGPTQTTGRNAFERIYLRVFSLTAAFSFVWIFLMALYDSVEHKASSIFLFLVLAIVLFMAGPRIYRSVNKKTLERIYCLVQMVSFLLMFYLAFRLRVSIYETWDYGRILRDAISLARTDEFENILYYARYPNNLFLLFCIEKVCRIVSAFLPGALDESYQAATIVLSVLMVQLAMVITWLAAKKLFGDKKAAFCGIVLSLVSPLYLYATFAYSDTLSLPFVAGQLYCYVSARKEKGVKRCALLFLTGVVGAIGYEFKITAAFFLIAVVIQIVLKGGIRKIAIKLSLILTSFLITVFCVSALVGSRYPITDAMKDEHQFPYVHWIMMSLNTSGGYTEMDVLYSAEQPDLESRTKADIEKIRERIEKRGIGGTCRHLLVTKVKRTWGNGAMAGDDYVSRQPLDRGLLHRFVSVDGEYCWIYQTCSQAFHLLLLLGVVLCAIFQAFRPKNEIKNLILTTVWGLFVFLLIWECNSRYLFQIIPFLVLLSADGFITLFDCGNKMKDGRRERWIDG